MSIITKINFAEYKKIPLDRNRFEAQNVSGLRNIPENVLQIIDKDFTAGTILNDTNYIKKIILTPTIKI